MIRVVRNKDIPQICAIYNYYIDNTTHTFEEEPVSLVEMAKRVSTITGSLPWYVYEDGGQVLGYAYAAKWKERAAYRHTVESTVYVEKNAIGRGIGEKLYRSLLAELKSREKHAVLAGIALPNERSRRLHARLGFKKVGRLREVGYKCNRWVDVEYWEMLFTGRGDAL